MNELELRQLVAGVVSRLLDTSRQEEVIPVEISARHVHLTQEDVETLFGTGHTLTYQRALSQPGQFLAEERVSLATDKGVFHHVAVLGPVRNHTQIELSLTDARVLGLRAPIRQSGDIRACPGICLLAGENMVRAGEAVMVAQNHIHMTPTDAGRFGVTDGQRVRVSMQTTRPVTFDDVLIRVREDFRLAMHIDFDEANACAFQSGETGRIIR